ncbi:hypothetical protein G6L37_01485 [Agrobacterium rubi]|nr:hypothetical protein [Agrobacterium rubi]NTF24065.1 hypothetical protein [Agrobacterium rubi]
MSLEAIQSIRIRDITDGVAQSMSTHEYFTCGRCWELAEALHELAPQSRIIEIRVSNGCWSMLVHAGIEIDGKVIDIEGCHDALTWISRWSAPWEDAAVSYRNGQGVFLRFENRRTMWIARHMASRLSSILPETFKGTREDTKKAA